jgi:hypothetical protein
VIARDPQIPQQALGPVAQAWAAGAIEGVQEPLLLLEGRLKASHVGGDRRIGEPLPDRGQVTLDGREVGTCTQQRGQDRQLGGLLLLREVGDPQVPGPRDEAALGRLQPRDRAQERRLPAAVRTDEPDPRPILDGPRELGEDRAVAVRARDRGEVGDDHAAI